MLLLCCWFIIFLGSDLVTYANECELRVSSCQRRKYIIVIKRGPCISCQDVHCDYGARCENGVCVCPRKCLPYYEPVCGSNNITYDNDCTLMTASCESTTQISVRHKGPCEDTVQMTSKLNEISESKNEHYLFPLGVAKFGQLCLVNTCKYDGICVIDDKHRSHCLCRLYHLFILHLNLYLLYISHNSLNCSSSNGPSYQICGK